VSEDQTEAADRSVQRHAGAEPRGANPPSDARSEGAYSPGVYEPVRQPASQAHTGWLVAVGIVLALGLGALTAAIIAKGDDDSPAVTNIAPVKTVQGSTTTIQQTTTVTAPPGITVAPDVTLDSSGSIEPEGGGAQGGSSPAEQSGPSSATTPSP